MTALQTTRSGVGPLLQRDYWAVIDGCSARPSEVAAEIARAFPSFAPPDIAVFRRRTDEAVAPLAVGDELEVEIRMAGTFAVRVVHRDANSLTLATLSRHPEAGRITFGAIATVGATCSSTFASRARSGSRMHRSRGPRIAAVAQPRWIGGGT